MTGILHNTILHSRLLRPSTTARDFTPLRQVTNAASCVVLCYNLYNHPLGRVDNVTARFTPADGPLVMHSLVGLSYNSTPLGRWLTITVLGHTYSPYYCPLGRDLYRVK